METLKLETESKASKKTGSLIIELLIINHHYQQPTAKSNLRSMIIPVSYTHLDVYKRQI